MPSSLPAPLGAGEAGVEAVDIGGRTVGAVDHLYSSSRRSGATIITPIFTTILSASCKMVHDNSNTTQIVVDVVVLVVAGSNSNQACAALEVEASERVDHSSSNISNRDTVGVDPELARGMVAVMVLPGPLRGVDCQLTPSPPEGMTIAGTLLTSLALSAMPHRYIMPTHESAVSPAVS